MFPIGLQIDFFEKKQKNLCYLEPFNLENEKEIFNMVFGIKTIKQQSKKRRQPKNTSKKLK